MTLALTLAAFRRHPVSLTITMLLVITFASLIDVAAPLALLGWVALTLLGLELSYALEPHVLRHLGRMRAPTCGERKRLESALGQLTLQPLVAQTSDLIAVRGLGCLVIGRDYLDLFEDRALGGLLTQATSPLHAANLAGYLAVRLGNLPLLCGRHASRCLCQLGRLLGILVGSCLVLPLVLWPDGFVRWSGRFFGAVFVTLLGSMLLSSGMAAAGLALLTAWASIRGVEAVLAWESRRVQRAADEVAIRSGYGPQLLEAVELLIVAEPRDRPTTALGNLLWRPGDALVDRAARIRHILATSA